jgi:hypothetical protein
MATLPQNEALEAHFKGVTDADLECKAHHVLPVKRLIKMCDPLACWSEQPRPITHEEVNACLAAQNEALVETPLWTQILFGKSSVTAEENRTRHIQKIAYFVRHGFDDPISIDVGIPELGGHGPEHLVDDGNHRLAAAAIRGDRVICVRVGGSVKHAQSMKLWAPTPEAQEIDRRYDEAQKKAQRSRRQRSVR